MIITITGNNGEFIYHIVTDGEKCSIVEQDADKVLTRFGKISINGNGLLEGKITTERALHAIDSAYCSTAKSNITLRNFYGG